MGVLRTDHLVPTASTVPSTDIGLGRPLSIRILSMYPGRRPGRRLLVTSAVKSQATYDAQPRAMHYAFDDVVEGTLLNPLASQSGSRIVYYSPSVLDAALDVELRFSYDSFDHVRASEWLDVASKAARLPVFAVATSLGGAGGAAAGESILYFAERAVRIVLGALDRFLDDDDWVAPGTLSLDFGASGISEAPPGYVLFSADSAGAQTLAPVDGDLRQQDWAPRSSAYQVDPRTGTVVYADEPGTTVMEDEPYVLTYVNGAAEDELEGWKAAAVSAALAGQFLNVSGGAADDLGALLEGYNDMRMATKYAEAVERLKRDGLGPEEKARRERERDAYFKYIQNDAVKDLLTAT